MIKHIIFQFLLLSILALACAVQASAKYDDLSIEKKDDSKKSLEKAISDIFQSFSEARNEAESTANHVVRGFEKAATGETNIVISDLVKSIFKSFNQFVDAAESVSKQVVSKGTNLNTNIEISKENYKRDSASFETLENESSKLGSRIGNLTNKFNIVDPVVGSLNGILKNFNRIMDKLTIKIDDTIGKSNWTALQPEQYDQGQVTEIPELVKRSIFNETSEGVKGLFQNINRIMDKLVVKIEDSIEKANWTQFEDKSKFKETISTKRDLSIDNPTILVKTTTSMPSVTADNKYQKIGEYYKNKFAERYKEAGKEFSNALQELTVDIINSYSNKTAETD